MLKFGSSLLLAAVGVRAMELSATQTQLLDRELARALDDGYNGTEAPSSGHLVPNSTYLEVTAGTDYINIPSCIHYNPHAAVDDTYRYCSRIYGIQSELRQPGHWSGRDLPYVANVTARWLEVLSHDSIARSYRNQLLLQENLELSTTKNECIEALDQTTSDCEQSSESLNATCQDQISALVNEATTAAANLTGVDISSVDGADAIVAYISETKGEIENLESEVKVCDDSAHAAVSTLSSALGSTDQDLTILTVASAAATALGDYESEQEAVVETFSSYVSLDSTANLTTATSAVVETLDESVSTVTSAVETLETALNSTDFDFETVASAAAIRIGVLESEATIGAETITALLQKLRVVVIRTKRRMEEDAETIAALEGQVADLQSQVTAAETTISNVQDAAAKARDDALLDIEAIEGNEHELVAEIQEAKDAFGAVNSTDPTILYNALKNYTQVLADRFVTLDELLADEIAAHLAYANASAVEKATLKADVAACESKYELCESRRGESDQEIEEVKNNLESIVELYGNTYMQAAADFGNYSEYLAEPSTDEWDASMTAGTSLMQAKASESDESSAAVVSTTTAEETSDSETTAGAAIDIMPSERGHFSRVERKKSFRSDIRPVSFSK